MKEFFLFPNFSKCNSASRANAQNFRFLCKTCLKYRTNPTILNDEQPSNSPEYSVALFDQSIPVNEHSCQSIQNILSSRTCDQCGSYYGPQALLKNHSFLHKTKRQKAFLLKAVIFWVLTIIRKYLREKPKIKRTRPKQDFLAKARAKP